MARETRESKIYFVSIYRKDKKSFIKKNYKGHFYNKNSFLCEGTAHTVWHANNNFSDFLIIYDKNPNFKHFFFLKNVKKITMICDMKTENSN